MSRRRPAAIVRSPHEKFLRRAEDDAERALSHRIRTRFDGRHRAVCSCSWIGDARDTPREAEEDGRAHLDEAA